MTILPQRPRPAQLRLTQGIGGPAMPNQKINVFAVDGDPAGKKAQSQLIVSMECRAFSMVSMACKYSRSASIGFFSPSRTPASPLRLASAAVHQDWVRKGRGEKPICVAKPLFGRCIWPAKISESATQTCHCQNLLFSALPGYTASPR